MKKFNSVFLRKNKTIKILAMLYAVVASGLLFVLVSGSPKGNFYRDIVFLVLMLFMLLRYLLFIFEKTYVDCQKGELRFKYQRKVFHIKDIVSLVKQPRRSMVKGQMRITCLNGEQYPIYVDDEDRFIELLLSVNSDILVS